MFIYCMQHDHLFLGLFVKVLSLKKKKEDKINK